MFEVHSKRDTRRDGTETQEEFVSAFSFFLRVPFLLKNVKEEIEKSLRLALAQRLYI